MLVLHLSVVAINHLVLAKAAESIDRSAGRNAQVAALLAMDRDIETLQGTVLSFMYTGDQALARRVTEGVEHLSEALTVHSDGAFGSSRSGDLAPMMDALRSYEEGLVQVIAQRGHQSRVLIDSVRPFAAETRATLSRLLAVADAQGASEAVAKVGAAIRRFDRAEEVVLAYQLDPSGALVHQFREASGEFAVALEDLVSADVEPIRAGVDAWRRSVFHVFSSTRSYLHLVNVVLAGQALEFRTLSSLWIERALDAQAVEEMEAQLDGERLRELSDWAGILTVLAGLLAGWWISRSVSAPITEMSDTFTALAAGHHVEIAGTDRRDELGQLAKAAEVFAERNRETRALLVQADRMARERETTNGILEKHVAELKLRNEDLDSFSYSASHDLRAPLRSIALLAEWIQEDAASSLPSESVEHLQLMVGRVQRLDKLLDGLLAYARIGRAEDLKQRFSVRGAIDDAVEAWGGLSAVRVSVVGEDVELEAPRVAFHKVVQNLVSNAVAHHDREVAHVTIEIQVDDDHLELRVGDDGPGIPALLHERVFQIFQTGKPRDVQEGSGIGLAIVQKMVYQAGGSIELDPAPGRGALFLVRWPLLARSESRLPVASEPV
ncbi:Phytochrome-like protein cph1 [Planctomycetes bacterium Poly30]|uniref:histidine kinase n=1 Tax=Saltatorellus ferox TaxID=2528018 RepID=A0A518EKG2_9BACT|nr:Phytochrome-like protein cph1 [Planctomycetes bacterium Poly30]